MTTTPPRDGGAGDGELTAERRCRLRLRALSTALLIAAIGFSGPHSGAQDNPPPADATAVCATPGNWIDGATGQAIDGKALIGDIAAKAAVALLGESHTSADHHYWQLHTMAALRARTDNMVIGFEAFPRRVQSVLDDWIAGKLTPEAFLNAVEWRRVWGFDAALYMPLFQFARLNRIPMIALNVERSLVARVGREGWAAVPAELREGVSDPAPASAAYLRELAGVHIMKRGRPADAANSAETPEPDDQARAQAMEQPEFKRFVEAQLTWDRAMAQALADAKRKFPDATVVGILGSGHVTGGHGVPYQLKNLGVSAVTTLIPVAADAACKHVGSAHADAMFTLPPGSDNTPPAERPRLGIVLTPGEGAPRIAQVASKSVAEATGLLAGDQVVRAAGLEMRNIDDLVETVGRQAPGTWLPLSIRRDGQEIEMIAKFPPRPRPSQ